MRTFALTLSLGTFLLFTTSMQATTAEAATSVTFGRNNSRADIKVTDADAERLFALLAAPANQANGKFVKTATYRAFGVDRLFFNCSATKADGRGASCAIALIDGPNAVIESRQQIARYLLSDESEAKKIAPLFRLVNDQAEIFTSRDKRLQLRATWAGLNYPVQFTLSHAR